MDLYDDGLVHGHHHHHKKLIREGKNHYCESRCKDINNLILII